MKTIIFAGVVALALTSMAQGTQAPAAAAKTEMKKTVAKKAKKAKAKAQMAPAAAAPVVEAAPVAVAPQAATSTTEVAAAPAPAKKWGASITLNPSSDFGTPTAVGTMTTFGASYKVTDSWKASLKGAFESVAAESVETQESRDYINANNFRSAYFDVGASTSLPAVMGSDAISLAITVRETVKDALVVREGSLAGMNRHIDVTSVMPFTITPKWSASVLGQYRNMDTDTDRLDRVIVMPSASYAINDVVSVYQSAGYMNSTQAGWELRPRRERLLLETGVDIAPMKGLSINLNVNQDKILSSTRPGETVTNLALYKPVDVTAEQKAQGAKAFDSVTYEAVIGYSF